MERIRAFLQHMPAEAINAMIDPDALAEIKRTDPNPTIKVFCIGHEGMAHGTQVGVGTVVMQYLRSVIHQMFDRLNIGTKIFHLHGGNNSHNGREPIGKVVGKTLMDIGGKLKTLAAVWIDPANRTKTLDVASIEADISYIPGHAGTHEAVEVHAITGIALADGRDEKPGFPEATMLAAIQAFVGGTTPKQTPGRDDKNMEDEFDPKKVTVDQLKAAIKEQGFKVDDLYSKKQIQDSDEGIRLQGVIDTLHTRKTALENSTKEANDRAAQLETQVRVFSSTKTLGALATERKLTDRQKAFIERNLSQFNPTADDAKDDTTMKAALVKFVDSQLETYKATAELFGVKDDATTTTPEEGKTTPPATPPATPPGDAKKGAADDPPANPMEDPAKNDFIPKV